MDKLDEWDKINDDYEVPSYIRFVTIAGLVCLGISFIFSVVLAAAFDHPRNEEDFKSTQGRNAMIILMSVFAALGIFFCCFVFYGHYLKNQYDPKSIIKGPVNVIAFPHIDKEIKVNDLTDPTLLPGRGVRRPSNYVAPVSNRLRKEFL